MKFKISVVICTHNPNLGYFKRVLSALRFQTLEKDKWQLLIVDNASSIFLKNEIDLSWHPNARVVREDVLGLTVARLLGIVESSGDIIVFVDDDNILDSNYLEEAQNISAEWKFLGAWGGKVEPEFEEVPAAWTKPYWRYLAIREFNENKWANLPDQYEALPCGAGLCIRRCVANKYLSLAKTNPRRMSLGRIGSKLISCEDIDIAFMACEMGLGTGRFTSLELTHIIPSYRLQEDYLLQLVEGVAYSSTILNALWGKGLPSTCRSQKVFQLYLRWRMDRRSKRFYDATQTGKLMAIKDIKAWQ